MKHKAYRSTLIVAFLLFVAAGTHAAIQGVEGQEFTLTAKSGYLSTPDGNSVLFWGYANGDGTAQYPGVTMIVSEDEPVTVTLNNTLDVPVSIVFPGQSNVTADGGTAGLLANEVGNGESVTYSFTPTEPGTYLYHSGTRPELQIEMGLVGALIVRPFDFDPNVPNLKKAYAETGSEYDREFLFLLTEMDPVIHNLVEQGRFDEIDNTQYWPVNWFINGRCAPDTMFPPFVDWLPTQPYNCMPMIYPGEKMLMRMIGAGRDQHPFHHHLNHGVIIAQDGRPLTSDGQTIDRGIGEFTIQSVPGGTQDAIWTWTGAGLGWDIYNCPQDVDYQPKGWESGGAKGPEDVDHNGNGVFDSVPLHDLENEYAPDHGKPFPVQLPEAQDLTFGGFWSGSPFLGALEALPPGEGGLNPTGGFAGMWHSHTEKEMVNNDIFPGGMMTMVIVVPPNVPMPGGMGM
jgi:hypothetical protein